MKKNQRHKHRKASFSSPPSELMTWSGVGLGWHFFKAPQAWEAPARGEDKGAGVRVSRCDAGFLAYVLCTPGARFIQSFSPENGEITKRPEERRAHAQSGIERKVVPSPTGWRAAGLYCPVEGSPSLCSCEIDACVIGVSCVTTLLLG